LKKEWLRNTRIPSMEFVVVFAHTFSRHARRDGDFCCVAFLCFHSSSFSMRGLKSSYASQTYRFESQRSAFPARCLSEGMSTPRYEAVFSSGPRARLLRRYMSALGLVSPLDYSLSALAPEGHEEENGLNNQEDAHTHTSKDNSNSSRRSGGGKDLVNRFGRKQWRRRARYLSRVAIADVLAPGIVSRLLKRALLEEPTFEEVWGPTRRFEIVHGSNARALCLCSSSLPARAHQGYFSRPRYERHNHYHRHSIINRCRYHNHHHHHHHHFK